MCIKKDTSTVLEHSHCINTLEPMSYLSTVSEHHDRVRSRERTNDYKQLHTKELSDRHISRADIAVLGYVPKMNIQ